jgi:hypothetical protein
MPDSHSARARWRASPFAQFAASTAVTFLVILVGLLTADKNPSLIVWIAGAAAALVAGAITFFQARRADRERTELRDERINLQTKIVELQEQIAGQRQEQTSPSVELLEPSEGDVTHDSTMQIRGRVRIKGLPDNAVGSALKDRELDIVSFVRSIAKDKWYSQNRVTFNQSTGEFQGTVRIGEPTKGARESYQIAVGIVQRAYIPENDKPADTFPLGVTASSERRTVRRLN